jgi:hypothetical protein
MSANISKNRFIQAWLPPAIYYFLLQFLAKLRFLFADKSYLKNNLPLQDTGKGKRAFLIATGPSLKQEDLSVLKGEDCFSVSNFFLHAEINTVNPRFHFFAPFHPPLLLENFIDWLKKADEMLPPATGIVLGYSDRKLVGQYGLFKNRKVHYMYFSYHLKMAKPDLLRPLLWPQTGPLMILPMLLYMGYEKIYLLGCDHTVLRDFGNTIPHFYDKEKDVRKNASDSGAWADIVKAHYYSMNSFVQYKRYSNFINKNYLGTRVINLSRDSWLDMFEKETLDKIIRP